MIPGDTFLERILYFSFLIGFFKRQHIGTHPIVADIGKMPFGTCLVSKLQPSGFEEFNLLLIGQWWLCLSFHPLTILFKLQKYRKNPV